jgi:hypothetical protein
MIAAELAVPERVLLFCVASDTDGWRPGGPTPLSLSRVVGVGAPVLPPQIKKQKPKKPAPFRFQGTFSWSARCWPLSMCHWPLLNFGVARLNSDLIATIRKIHQAGIPVALQIAQLAIRFNGPVARRGLLGSTGRFEILWTFGAGPPQLAASSFVGAVLIPRPGTGRV